MSIAMGEFLYGKAFNGRLEASSQKINRGEQLKLIGWITDEFTDGSVGSLRFTFLFWFQYR
jgi:hypothetical protein